MAGEELLDERAMALEDLYLGLRTVEGVPRNTVPEPSTILWVREGWARVADGRVSLTPEGWLRLDALVASVEMAGIFPKGLSLEHVRTPY